MISASGVCVCVTPCFQGFRNDLPLHFLTSARVSRWHAGACDTLLLSHATKLWRRVGRETWPVSCTCNATFEQAVQSDRFAFMVLHDTPPKPSHRVLAAEPRVFVSISFLQLERNICSNTFNSSDFSPFGSTTFLPIVAIELTENQCQSVSRSVVPLGCWV